MTDELLRAEILLKYLYVIGACVLLGTGAVSRFSCSWRI
jgi:hypothetical protein